MGRDEINILRAMRFPNSRGVFRRCVERPGVERLTFGQPGQAEGRQEFVDEMGLRFRDIEQGPDGLLYLATEVRYGSGTPDGTVIPIEPADR